MKNLPRVCVLRSANSRFGGRTAARRHRHARLLLLACVFAVAAVLVSNGDAQTRLSTSHGRNYIEANVGDYTVPDPLLGKDGQEVTDTHSWLTKRRGEILRDFRDLMYGHTPELPITVKGVNTTRWPQPDTPVGETIGYHLRTGRHAITSYDWEQFLDFVGRHHHSALPAIR